MRLVDLANPTRFLALVSRMLPYFAGLTTILLGVGLNLGLLAPDDYLLSLAVVGILIGWIALDYRGQTRRRRELESSGIARRSGRSATDIR